MLESYKNRPFYDEERRVELRGSHPKNSSKKMEILINADFIELINKIIDFLNFKKWPFGIETEAPINMTYITIYK